MSGIFSGCSLLKELNLSNFDTTNVTHMNNMFKECVNLNNLNISNFQIENLKYSGNMFYQCNSLPQSKILQEKFDKKSSENDSNQNIKKIFVYAFNYFLIIFNKVIIN